MEDRDRPAGRQKQHNLLYRGDYMSDHVLLNLFKELRINGIMRGFEV